MNFSSVSRIALISVAAVFATSAGAASLDFTIESGGFIVEDYENVDLSTTAPDFTGGNITSEAGFATILLDADGENLDIAISDPGAGNPYFDADSGGPGGLGSCRNFTASAQCNPNNDDNLTLDSGESIHMGFQRDDGSSVGARFGAFVFHDDNHDAITGNVQVTHDNGTSLIAIVSGVADFSGIATSEFLLFEDEGTNSYYISGATITAVPVPAAVWLFGSALGMLGWIRRKKA